MAEVDRRVCPSIQSPPQPDVSYTLLSAESGRVVPVAKAIPTGLPSCAVAAAQVQSSAFPTPSPFLSVPFTHLHANGASQL